MNLLYTAVPSHRPERVRCTCKCSRLHTAHPASSFLTHRGGQLTCMYFVNAELMYPTEWNLAGAGQSSPVRGPICAAAAVAGGRDRPCAGLLLGVHAQSRAGRHTAGCAGRGVHLGCTQLSVKKPPMCVVVKLLFGARADKTWAHSNVCNWHSMGRLRCSADNHCFSIFVTVVINFE